jgi:6-phospho-3-hexuloisomerase
MRMNETPDAIISEIRQALASVTEAEWHDMAARIKNAPRIFVQGSGRSGYVGRGFAMRLMQMGFVAFFVGETITPAMESGDLLITLSGSGNTTHLSMNMDSARRLGAVIYLITAHKASPMAEMADRSIVIAGPTKMQAADEHASCQLIGSLFEQGAFIFCEAIVDILAKEFGLGSDDMMKRHANLE